MKVAFLLVSLLCAACLGLLSYIVATGRIPLRAAAPADSAKAAAAAPDGPVEVSPVERAELDKLIQSLKDEQQQYARRKSELEASQSADKLKDQVAVLSRLKTDVEGVKARLDEEIKSLEETEKKNLQALSEVYAKVEPERAAQILLQMERKRAAVILSMMEGRAAAAVLDAVSGLGDESIKVAVEWSDIIRKVKGDENAKKGKPAQ